MYKKVIVLGVALTLGACGAADTTPQPTTASQARPTTAPVEPTAAPVEPTAAGVRPTTATGGATQPGAGKQYAAYPAMTIDPAKEYIATLVTEKGEVKVKLFPKSAPKAVNSFVFLARDGYYNDITFHRVLAGFVAQTGDPEGTGSGGPGYSFEDEYDPALGLAYDREGILGMANAGPNTNGSQFFITYGDVGLPPQQYTIFGQVVEGMDVLKKIDVRDPSMSQALPPGNKLFTITIDEK